MLSSLGLLMLLQKLSTNFDFLFNTGFLLSKASTTLRVSRLNENENRRKIPVRESARGTRADFLISEESMLDK